MKDKIIQLGISAREADELIKISYNIEEDYIKLKDGYPIQYLIGYVNFCGNKINVNENVLIPRFETEYLIERTLNNIKKYNLDITSILDLCTGSGCIGITLKKIFDCKMVISDISKDALDVATRNVIEHDANIKVVKSNLFAELSGKYDLIISNPPYVNKNEQLSKTVLFEPHEALFAEDNGNKITKEIINDSVKHINKRSIIAIEINSNNANELIEYSKTIYPTSIIFVEKDLTNRDRYLFIINE